MGKEKKCTCESKFQDKLYGKGMRYMNTTAKGYRCTICGKEYTENNSSK